jgi:microsomal epoxide hydrolase
MSFNARLFPLTVILVLLCTLHSRAADPTGTIEAQDTSTPDHRAYLQPAPTATPRLVLTRPKPTGDIPVVDGYFSTDDHVQLHYLESGQGLPIIFIPGWLLPAEIWRFQLEGLAEDFHVIALDPRSQGDSQMTHQGNDPIRQAHDIQQLMDHLQLNSVVLVGWSHGSFQTLAYEGQFGTDRLYAMVLVDSPLAPATTNPAAAGSRMKFLKSYQTDHNATIRNFIWGLFKNHPSSDFTKKLVQAASRTPIDIGLDLMNNAFPGDAWQPTIQVMRQIPMLYAVTPKFTPQAQYLTEVDPLARVEFFNNAGHALFVDEVDHFNETLREFLRKAAVYPGGYPTKPKRTPTQERK